MCRSVIKRSVVLVVLFSLLNVSTPYPARAFSEKTGINNLRPLSSKIHDNGGNIIMDNAAAKASAAGDAMPKDIITGKNPQAYLSSQFTKAEWRKVLTELGGPIIDISMEAILPELGVDALEGSKGGLGILEGDSGEGYAKAVWDAHVPGIKAFITLPLYEYKLIANTDPIGKRQYLEGQKVAYDKLIDYDNPVDCSVFADPKRFNFPELKSNPSKPVKILADDNGKQLSFNTMLYDELSGRYRNFKAVAFVVNRGGTPAFLIACQDVKNILYPDDESSRLNQQILTGKVAPALYKRLGIRPAVIRINEAHTIIAMAEMMQDRYFKDTSYVFTNHTPITAGLQIYYGKYYWFSRLGLPDIFEDKARNLKIDFKSIFVDDNGNLNFSHAAMVLAQLVNGVSNAHGITLQKMFPLFKDKIRAILNGTGEFWKSDTLVKTEEKQKDITPLALWKIHQKDKKVLAELIKERIGHNIDVNMPTAIAIRRIDYYKQQYPMLKDIVKALCQDRGVKTKVWLDGKEQELEGLGMQIIIGGIIVNEHNQDLQYWVSEFIRWMEDPAFKGRFIFISGNDLELMKIAANGCDCWIEMPRRNLDTAQQEEASGTSGMRAAECGNIPIMSSGMWGDEFVRQYDPETNEGNGFILKDITPIELYDALSIISGLYYDFMDNRNNGLTFYK